MTIDSHHHFWNYEPVEYSWIDDGMAPIRRDFGPSDLRAALDEAGIEGAVSVQARQTVEETRWLLELASAHPWLLGVVGWVPLCEPNLNEVLDEFGAHPKLKDGAPSGAGRIGRLFGSRRL